MLIRDALSLDKEMFIKLQTLSVAILSLNFVCTVKHISVNET